MPPLTVMEARQAGTVNPSVAGQAGRGCRTAGWPAGRQADAAECPSVPLPGMARKVTPTNFCAFQGLSYPLSAKPVESLHAQPAESAAAWRIAGSWHLEEVLRCLSWTVHVGRWGTHDHGHNSHADNNQAGRLRQAGTVEYLFQTTAGRPSVHQRPVQRRRQGMGVHACLRTPACQGWTALWVRISTVQRCCRPSAYAHSWSGPSPLA